MSSTNAMAKEPPTSSAFVDESSEKSGLRSSVPSVLKASLLLFVAAFVLEGSASVGNSSRRFKQPAAVRGELDRSGTSAARASPAGAGDPSPERFVVVTFGSLGPPHDDGLNMQAARGRFEGLIGPHADALRMSSPGDLMKDPWWLANFHVYPDTPDYVIERNPGGKLVHFL